MDKFLPETIIKANSEAIFSEMDKDLVMMDIKKGNYYGLNSVGSAIWKSLQSPKTFSKLMADLEEQYDVCPKKCAQEVSKFLSQLKKQGLIEIQP